MLSWRLRGSREVSKGGRKGMAGGRRDMARRKVDQGQEASVRWWLLWAHSQRGCRIRSLIQVSDGFLPVRVLPPQPHFPPGSGVFVPLVWAHPPRTRSEPPEMSLLGESVSPPSFAPRPTGAPCCSWIPASSAPRGALRGHGAQSSCSVQCLLLAGGLHRSLTSGSRVAVPADGRRAC